MTTTESKNMTVLHFEQVPVTVPQGVHQSYVQEAIAAIFYNQGILDLKQARTLAGKSRREFEEDTLPKFGFTIMDGVDIDLEINDILNGK